MASKNVDLNIRVGVKDDATHKVKNLESSIIRFVGAVSAALASLKLVLFPITEAAQFERSMKDVQKTTNFTDAEIKNLSESLREMSTEIAVSADDLATIAATAGQLGLGAAGAESIEKFTKSVAMASVTLGIAEDAAAEAGAVIANIFNIDPGNIERVFSTINELSNNSVAETKSLIDIIKRVGNTADLQFSQVAALAAQTKQVGLPDEQAGTFLVKAFSNMLAEGEKFAKAMGITQNEWISRVKQDAVQAFNDINAKLYEMEAGIRELTTKKLFGSGRLFSGANKFIEETANGQADLAKFLDLSNQAYVEGTSSIREYNIIVSATTEQYKLLKNGVNELAIGLGTKLLPKINSVIQQLQEFVKSNDAVFFFDQLAVALEAGIDNIIAFTKTVANMEIPWSNIINVIEIFLTIGIAKAIQAITVAIFGQIAGVGKLALAYRNLATARLSGSGDGSGAVLTKNTQATTSAAKQLHTTLGAISQKVRQTATGMAVFKTSTIDAAAATSGALKVEQNKAAIVKQTGDIQARAAAQRLTQEQGLLSLVRARAKQEHETILAAARGDKARQVAEKNRWAREERARKQWEANLIAMEAKLTAFRVANEKKVAAARAAATAAGTVENTYLAAQNAAFLASQKKAQGIIGTIKKATGMVGVLGSLFAKVGRIAMAAFTHPIASALLFVGLFWDEIRDFFDFASRKNEEAKADQAAVVRKFEQTISDSTALLTKTKGELKAVKGASVGVVDFEQLIDEGSVTKVKTTIKNIVNEFDNLSKIKEGAEKAAAGFANVITVENRKLKSNQKELDNVNKKLDEYKLKLSQGYSVDSPNVLDQSEVDELKKKQIEYTGAIAASTEKLQEWKGKSVEAYEAVTGAEKGLSTSITNLAKVMDASTLNYVALKNKANEYSEELQETEKRLKSYEATLKTLGKTEEELQEGETNTFELRSSAARRVEELKVAIKSTAGEIKTARSQISGDMLGVADHIDTMSVSGVANLSKLSRSIEFASGEVKSLEQVTKDAAPKLVANYLGWKRYKEELERAGGAILAFKANAKGVLDNTAKEIESLVSRAAKFAIDFNSKFQDRKLELELEFKSDKALEQVNKYDKKIKEITEDFDKDIARREAEGGDTTKLERLKKEALLKFQIKKHAIEQGVEDKKLVALAKAKFDEAKKFEAEVVRLADISKTTGDVQAGRDALFNKDAAKAALDEWAKFQERRIELTKLGSLDGRETPLISQTEVNNITATFRSMSADIAGSIAEVNQNAFAGISKGAKPYADAIEAASAKVSVFKEHIDTLGETYKGFSEVITQLEENFATTVPQMEQLVESIRGIADASFGGNVEINESNLENISKTFGEKMKVAVNTALEDIEFTSDVAKGLSDKFDTAFVTDLRDKINKAASDGVKGIKFNEDGVPYNVNLAPDEPELQKNLGNKVYDLKVNLVDKDGKPLKLGGTTSVVGQQFASGGPVSGPGTGKSDSILSWLSNGEFVIDAMTTSFFGSSFFSMLQSLARGGIKNRIQLPRFASGGPVLPSPSGAAVAPAGVGDSVTVNLNVGGSTHTLYGERRQVKDFVTALRKTDKGL